MKILAVTLLSLLSVAAHAADRVKPGQWETTLTLGKNAPMVTKYCITAAEATSMNGDLPTLRKYLVDSTAKATNGRCSVTKVEASGNRTVVAIACGKTSVVGTTTYFGDRYSTSNSDGSTVTGKRVGACPK